MFHPFQTGDWVRAEIYDATINRIAGNITFYSRYIDNGSPYVYRHDAFTEGANITGRWVDVEDDTNFGPFYTHSA